MIVLKKSLLFYFSIFIVLINPLISHGFNGQFFIINPQLGKAAEEGLPHVKQLASGPMRATLRNMLEAISNTKMPQSFLSSVTNGRAFNPAIVSGNNDYIFAVRVTYRISDEPIVPGNRPESKFEKGKNFWWQDFASSEFQGGTLYFHTDKELQNFQALLPLNLPHEWIKGQDTRLYKISDNIVAFNPKNKNIAAAIIYETTPTLGVIEFDDNLPNKKAGNNYSAITIDLANNKYSYLDWFFKEGVRFTSVSDDISYTYLKYLDDKYPVLGTGSSMEDGENAEDNSGIMPLFSVGSSHIKIDNNTYVGVGHTKIYVDEDLFHYKPDSNIENFRKNLVLDLKDNYGDRYIRHDAFNSKVGKSQGYHYLMYFYYFKLDEKGNPIEMKISDSYLPINIEEASNKNNYVFSLVFPMSIIDDLSNPENVLISAGIGDYYAALMRLPRAAILELCKHDIQKLHMEDYNYHIMRFNADSTFDIVDRLITK